MKKNLSIALIALVIIAACQKDKKDPEPETPVVVGDVTPPVLTLKGNKNDTVVTGTLYKDPGVIATDNKDGDLTPFIVISAMTQMNGSPRNYSIEYNVRDAAGNKSKEIRTIHFKNDIDYVEGSYLVACTCTYQANGTPTTYSNKIYSSSASSSLYDNNTFSVDTLDLGNGPGKLIGNPFNINPTTASSSGTNWSVGGGIDGYIGDIDVVMSPSKKSFTVETRLSNKISFNIKVNCTNVYTKQ